MLSTFRALGRRGPALVVILAIGSFVAACGGPTAGAPQRVPAAGPGDDQSGSGAVFGAEGDGQGSRGSLYLTGQPDLLIIKTGEMVLQVTGINDALTSATQQITGLGGYASGSERSGDGDSDQASITFRIPAAHWDEALAALRGVATKVLAERSATDDVTSQVVDLGARLKNLQATEAALQAIMARATEIKDVLAVQAELTSTRGQIEELTAQKAHLEEQAAFSTLRVTFSLKPDPVLTSTTQFDPTSEVDQASASLVRLLQGLATAGIWFAIVWLPILVALAIIVGIGWFIARRVRRSTGGVAAPPATPTA